MLVRVLQERGYPHFYRAIRSRHEYEDWKLRIPDGLRYLWFGVLPH
jgi:enterochelin esterase-like enzyme